MDSAAAAIANMLVGNETGETVIEVHFPACSLLFKKACMVALAGANFNAVINNGPVPLHTAIIVSAGSVLTFTRPVWGARCYLAIQGGWDASYWMGSYSTNLRVQAGGYHGLALRKGDTLHSRMELFAFATLPGGSVMATP